jgi:hypothetical protein
MVVLCNRASKNDEQKAVMVMVMVVMMMMMMLEVDGVPLQAANSRWFYVLRSKIRNRKRFRAWPLCIIIDKPIVGRRTMISPWPP